jgi:hypothetical protein
VGVRRYGLQAVSQARRRSGQFDARNRPISAFATRVRPRASLPGSSRTFRRSSLSSAGSALRFCSGAAAMASARGFHGRCDGHAPTLTLIQDKNGNIFCGFTPVEWESDNKCKADPSLKSFIFTLKNPYDFPASKFALKAEKKDRAISCRSSFGPSFPGSIIVADFSSIGLLDNTRSFGDCYVNDTGLPGGEFFTGSNDFSRTEIEVFEITD